MSALKRARAILIGAAWYLSWAAFLLFPPLLGTVVLIAIGAAFVWRYLVCGTDAPLQPMVSMVPRRRRFVWAGIGIASYLLFELGILVLYVRLAGLPPTGSAGIFDAYAQRPLGWLPLAVLAVAVAPPMEEWLFRGVVLRSMRNRVGTISAVVTSAVLFAALHGSTWAFPLHLAFGVATALLVVATDSLWPSVALHAAVNATDSMAGVIVTAVWARPMGSQASAAIAMVALLGALAAGSAFVTIVYALRRARLETAPSRRSSSDVTVRAHRGSALPAVLAPRG